MKKKNDKNSSKLLKLLPNVNQPILIKEGQRLSRKQLTFILNHLTTNQNEIILNQNRIASHLSQLIGVFKDFAANQKNSTEAELVVEKEEKRKTKINFQTSNETLSFSEEMKNLNEELQKILDTVPKFNN